MNKEQEYQRICEKLGCKPTDLEMPDFVTDEDRWVSPLGKLSVDEFDVLYSHGVL